VCSSDLFGRTKPDSEHLFCSEHWYMSIVNGIKRGVSFPLPDLKSILDVAENKLNGCSPTPGDIPTLGFTQGMWTLKE
jgi:hypothetical protein